MILNIFILILAIEIISGNWWGPPDGDVGGPIIKYQPGQRISRPCQPGKRLWCVRDGVPPDPRLVRDGVPPDPRLYFGPFFPIPPVKCSRAPDPDGPGPVNVNPDPDWPTGPNVPYDPYDPGPIPVPTGLGLLTYLT